LSLNRDRNGTNNGSIGKSGGKGIFAAKKTMISVIFSDVIYFVNNLGGK